MPRERYYADSRGHNPAPDRGEAEPLIKGFAGNKHKAFRTLNEAEQYLANNGVPEDQRVVLTLMDEPQGQVEEPPQPYLESLSQ
ncbi:hypothetical protein BJX63DRAFT_434132 [Aspergillus granulosus]|uniref:Ribonuclease H1 N-terminal domain-containing protein n=1 Tax=Aspergillus granulosus TaxID=176169 RepID=A0ABR4H582_9EURO